jgi:hypothetical protein
MFALDHGVAAQDAAPAIGLSPEHVVRAFRMIQSKREAARYLHAPAAVFNAERPV